MLDYDELKYIEDGSLVEISPFLSSKLSTLRIQNLNYQWLLPSEIIEFNNGFFKHISKFLTNKNYCNLYVDGNSQNLNENVGGFVRLSFVEKNKEVIKTSNNIANPGCFALCAQLSILPFKDIATSAFINVVTGSSGGGKDPSTKNHHSTRSKNMFSYGINSHRHLAEIYQSFPDLEGNLSFIPTSGPFVRGIFLTAELTLKSDFSLEELKDKFELTSRPVRSAIKSKVGRADDARISETSEVNSEFLVHVFSKLLIKYF